MKKELNGKQYNLTEDANGVITLTPEAPAEKFIYRGLYQDNRLQLRTTMHFSTAEKADSYLNTIGSDNHRVGVIKLEVNGLHEYPEPTCASYFKQGTL